MSRASDEMNCPDGEPIVPNAEDEEPPLLTKEEAIAEVNRWIDRYTIDQNQIFARIGELVICYRDLIPHLEQETDEGRLLLRAISRGRVVRGQRGLPGGIDRAPE
jgi:hypothetical protein